VSPREHGGSNALLIRWSSVSTVPATAAITPAGASADAEDSISEKALLQLVPARLGARLVPVHAMLEELGELAPKPAAAARGACVPASPLLRHFAGGGAHDAESFAAAEGCRTDEAAAHLTLLEIEGRLRRRLDGRHEAC
jgi:hypothetical protein